MALRSVLCVVEKSRNAVNLTNNSFSVHSVNFPTNIH